MGVVPYGELGPGGEGEDADALAPGLAGIVETPELRPLIFRVPAVVGRAEGENPLLGPALLLVPPGAAEGRVEPVAIQRLLETFRLPHDGVERAMVERVDALGFVIGRAHV